MIEGLNFAIKITGIQYYLINRIWIFTVVDKEGTSVNHASLVIIFAKYNLLLMN